MTYQTALGTSYPASTYLLSPGGSQASAIGFSNFIEGNTAQSNYRLTNTSPFSARCTSGCVAAGTDGRDLGADIDEIEALTGKNGKDVEDGVPEFSVRSARQIQEGETSAIFSYVPLSPDSCVVRVWNNGAYSGAPVVNMTDAAAEINNGLKTLTLSGLTRGSSYFGKRWCGANVDVFSFRTQGAASADSLALPLPVGATDCIIQHGSTAGNLNQTITGIVVNGLCHVKIPASAAYYRHAYRAYGSVKASGSVQKQVR